MKEIDLAYLAKLPGQSFEISRAHFGCPFLAVRKKTVQRLFQLAEFPVALAIKKSNEPFVRHSFDLLGAHQGRIPAVIANLLSEPLKMFVLRRLIGKQVGRCLDLEGPDFLELSPDSDPGGVLLCRQAVEQKKPGS